MTELEKVEKLREKAGISFSEAKQALDNTGGDILDALIYLEKQGKVAAPAGGAVYTGTSALMLSPESSYDSEGNGGNAGSTGSSGEPFSDLLKRIGRFCLKMLSKGNSNFLEATRGDDIIFSLPVTALVVLVIFFFWFTVPLLVLSLFFGFRYGFRGPDLDRDSVNTVMDSAANVVDEVKNSFTNSANNTEP